MGQQLYAVEVYTGRSGFAPTPEDEAAYEMAVKELAKRRPAWEAKGLVPSEKRFIGPSDRLENYGILTFDLMFLPRQLLGLVVAAEELRHTIDVIRTEVADTTRAEAIQSYLSLCLSKAADVQLDPV